MIADLHNHTLLCNHATGTIDQYIKKAIEKETAYFGFSDHAPMNFDQNYRMRFDQMKMYEADILSAKIKYEGKIEILLGYEVDFLPGYIDQRVLDAKVDYLIGSVHFIDGWGFDNPEFIGNYKNKDIDKIWQEYFDAIKMMAKSQLFNIVGHIDLIKVFNFLPKKDIRIIAKEALDAIKKADMAVEINMAGLRKPVKELYPSQKLLQQIRELDIPICFGSDAHKPEDISLFAKEAKNLAKSTGYEKCAIFKDKQRDMINF